MKGIKILIAILFLGTVFSQNAGTADAASKTETLYVTADKLNVREKPSTKSKSVGSLKLGTKLKVYSQAKNGWSNIDYKKKKAYVYSKYIKKAPKNQFSRIKFFAKQGQLETTLPLVVRDKAFTAIDYLGKPYYTENNRALDLYFKNHVNKAVLTIEEDGYRDSGLTYKTMTKKSYVYILEQFFNDNKKITYKDVKSVLGKADYTNIFWGDNDFEVGYDLGAYQLVFHTHNLEGSNVKLTENKRFLSYSVTKTFVPNN